MRENNKNFIYLLTGHTSTELGGIVFDYANSVLIASLGNRGSFFMALYRSSETIINLIFNLIGGVLADRKDRKKILVVTDMLAGVTCLGLFFIIGNEVQIPAIVIANILLATLYSFNAPTYRSILVNILSEKEVVKYNSYSNVSLEAINVLAPVIGIAITNYFSISQAMLFNSLTFFVSGYLESRLTVVGSKEKRGKESKIFIELKDGLKYLLNRKSIFLLLGIASFVNFFYAGLTVVLPYVSYFNGSIPNAYGVILVLQATGSVIASILKVKETKSNTIKGINMSLFFMGLSLVFVYVLSHSNVIYLKFVPFIFSAMALTLFNIQFMSYLQLNVDDVYQGRVFSTVFTMAIMFMPIGSFVFTQFLSREWQNFGILGLGIILSSLLGEVGIKKLK